MKSARIVLTTRYGRDRVKPAGVRRVRDERNRSHAILWIEPTQGHEIERRRAERARQLVFGATAEHQVISQCIQVMPRVAERVSNANRARYALRASPDAHQRKDQTLIISTQRKRQSVREALE